MPVIPQYSRRLSLSQETPATKITPEDLGAGQAQAIGEMGKVISKVGETIRQVRIDEQESRGVLNSRQKMGEELLNAFNNPNIIFNEELHNQKLQQIRDESVALAGDGEAKRRIAARVDLDLVDYKLKIKQFSYKKLVEQKVFTYGDSKKAKLAEWAAEINPALKQKKVDEIAYEAKQLYDTGVLSQEDYLKEIKSIKETLPETQVRWYIYNDDSIQEKDSVLLTQIREGNEGIFANFTTTQRIELAKELKQRIFQNNQSYKKNEVANKVSLRNDFFSKLTTKDPNGKPLITWQQAKDKLVDIIPQDSKLAEAITKVTNREAKGKFYKYTEEDNKSFVQITKNIFTSGTQEEISNFLLKQVEVLGNTASDDDRFAILVQAAADYSKGLPVSELHPFVTPTPKHIEISARMKDILNNKNKVLNIGNMFVNFWKGMSGGKTPAEAHNEAVKSEVNRTNSLSVAYKVDDVITLPNGRLFQVTGFTTTGSPKGKIISGKRTTNAK